MSKIPTEFVGDAHAYTRSDVSWSVPTEKSGRERIYDFISGGGMRTFGRTVRQEEVRLKRMRFLALSAVLAAVWLFLLVF